MTYTVVQPQKNGKYYLYEVDAVWDPEKKRSKQKRTYMGPCDKDGNLISKSKRSQTIQCSPVFGPYHLFCGLAEDTGLTAVLDGVYGKEDGRRLLAMAILGVVSPCTVNQMESEVEDTYLREILDLDWSFGQSGVCRFLQTVGHDTGRREDLFRRLAPKSGCVIFDIVCLGTDSEDLEYAEVGRKTHLSGSKQVNLGMIHSMEDRLPFCYRTYPGSVADVATIDNIVSDLASIGCRPVELEMDRGFFSAGNVELMISRQSGFTVPIPARNGILKELISESVGRIESPLNSDCLAGGVVRGYETRVKLEDGEFVKAETDEEGGVSSVPLPRGSAISSDSNGRKWKKRSEGSSSMRSPGTKEFTADSTPMEASRYSRRYGYSPHYEIRMGKCHIIMCNGYPLVATFTDANASDCAELPKLLDKLPDGIAGTSAFLSDGVYPSFGNYSAVFAKFGVVMASNPSSASVFHGKRSWAHLQNLHASFWRKDPAFRPKAVPSAKIRYLIRNGKSQETGEFLRNLDMRRGRRLSAEYSRRRHVCECVHRAMKRWMCFDVRGLRRESENQRKSFKFFTAQVLSAIFDPYSISEGR